MLQNGSVKTQKPKFNMWKVDYYINDVTEAFWYSAVSENTSQEIKN